VRLIVWDDYSLFLARRSGSGPRAPSLRGKGGHKPEVAPLPASVRGCGRDDPLSGSKPVRKRLAAAIMRGRSAPTARCVRRVRQTPGYASCRGCVPAWGARTPAAACPRCPPFQGHGSVFPHPPFPLPQPATQRGERAGQVGGGGAGFLGDGGAPLPRPLPQLAPPPSRLGPGEVTATLGGRGLGWGEESLPARRGARARPRTGPIRMFGGWRMGTGPIAFHLARAPAPRNGTHPL
jgi:hypothetical protein